jgi:hypothetical protein
MLQFCGSIARVEYLKTKLSSFATNVYSKGSQGSLVCLAQLPRVRLEDVEFAKS